MAKIRHIAIATKDPEATARFYREHFELEEVGRVNGRFADGYYLSDGTINVAILNFKTDQLGRGMDYTGLHHFGFLVEDVEATSKQLEEDGAPRFEQTTPAMGGFEVKHRGPDGVVFDIAGQPWVGSAGLAETEAVR